MEQERLMDYTDSGFRAGFRRGLRCLTLAVTVLDAGTWPPDEYDR